MRRIVIIDVLHLFYKYAFGMATGRQCTLEVDGVLKTVDTLLPENTIKRICSWTNNGMDQVVVCFSSQNSARCRKHYFLNSSLRAKDGVSKVEYNGNRDFRDYRFIDGVDMTLRLLHNGGVTCLQGESYESADLIYAAVVKAKEEFPNSPIDIVTGNTDLVPLVDEQVSVFLASKKTTWAESSSIVKKNYVQLRPSNMSEYIEGLTDYKGLSVPYNSILLTKLLRGSKSHNIPGYRKFTPTDYRHLIFSMELYGVDSSSLFRYGKQTERYIYRDTLKDIPLDQLSQTPNDNIAVIYGEPEILTNMCNALSSFLEEPILEHMKEVYNGINLNCAFIGKAPEFSRRPAVMTSPVVGFDWTLLQRVVLPLGINIPIV